MKKESNNEYKPILDDYTPVNLGGGGVNKSPKNNVGIYVAVILILVFIIVILIANTGKLNNKYNDLEKYAMQLENQLAAVLQPTAEVTVTTISEMEKVELNSNIETSEDRLVVKYVSAEIVHKTKDEPILLVTYDFTNNSDEAASWMWDLRSKAFQNGIECGGYVSHDKINVQMQENDIKPGTTITIVEGYPLYDTANPITVEVTELFDNEPILTININTEDISIKSSTIELVAGELGEYGKELTYNANTDSPETIIAYYIPSESYTITNVGEYPTQINLCHNETKIVDGWQEPKNVYVETLDVGESIDWYVLDNYHFEISEPTHITLEPIKY